MAFKAKLKKIQKNIYSVTKPLVLRLADTPLLEIAFLATFVLSRWWLNSGFSYPGKIVIPLLLMSVLGTATFLIYRFILVPGLATHAAALLLSYIFFSYRF